MVLALIIFLFSAPVFGQSEWIHYSFEGGSHPNDVYAIDEDIQGNIWIGTAETIHMFDGSQWTSLDNINGYKELGTIHIATSSNGDVWATVFNFGIVKYSDGEWTFVDDYRDSYYSALDIDCNGNIWIGYSPEYAPDFLRRYDGETWTNYTDINGIGDCNIRDIKATDTGDVWIATKQGLFKTHVDSLDIWHHYSEENVLFDNSVRYIAIGPTGDVWLQCGHAISHFNGSSWEHITHFGDDDDFFLFQHITVDSSNTMWINHAIHHLCSYYEGEWELNKYFDENVFGNLIDISISHRIHFIDSQNRLWIGTDGGLFRHQLPTNPTIVQEKEPKSFTLSPPTPNPFNPVTTITYTLTESSPVTLAVYNVSGQKVATLVDERQTAGMHTATFDGTGLASGLYFAGIEVEGMVQTEKMVLMK